MCVVIPNHILPQNKVKPTFFLATMQSQKHILNMDAMQHISCLIHIHVHVHVHVHPLMLTYTMYIDVRACTFKVGANLYIEHVSACLHALTMDTGQMHSK